MKDEYRWDFQTNERAFKGNSVTDCIKTRNCKDVWHDELASLEVQQEIGLESYAGARLEGLVDQTKAGVFQACFGSGPLQ